MVSLTELQKGVIYKDCIPFLEMIDYDVDNYTLYRGMSVPLPSVYNSHNIGIIPGFREDRRPKDTPIDVHNKMNKLMELNFGKKFRNGLFVSGDIVHAQGYNTNTFMVFPIGEFDFCWSDKYIDAAIGLTEHSPESLIPDYYRNNDMKWAIESQNEIMLYVNQCYIVSTNYEIYTQQDI